MLGGMRWIGVCTLQMNFHKGSEERSAREVRRGVQGK